MIEQLALTELLGILGFILSVIGLFLQAVKFYFDRKKERGRQPKLSVTLHGSTHNSEKLIPNLTITNHGELPTSVREIFIDFETVRLRQLESGGTRVILKNPIRVEGKETVTFNDPLYAEGGFLPKEDIFVNLTIDYTEGNVKSEKVVSSYNNELYRQ